jgi:hypothetical protein
MDRDPLSYNFHPLGVDAPGWAAVKVETVEKSNRPIKLGKANLLVMSVDLLLLLRLRSICATL